MTKGFFTMGTRLEVITLENGLTLNWKEFTGGTYIDLTAST
jgi:hypothetical protein